MAAATFNSRFIECFTEIRKKKNREMHMKRKE